MSAWRASRFFSALTSTPGPASALSSLHSSTRLCQHRVQLAGLPPRVLALRFSSEKAAVAGKPRFRSESRAEAAAAGAASAEKVTAPESKPAHLLNKDEVAPVHQKEAAAATPQEETQTQASEPASPVSPASPASPASPTTGLSTLETPAPTTYSVADVPVQAGEPAPPPLDEFAPPPPGEGKETFEAAKKAAGMTYPIVLILCGLWILKVLGAALYMALVEPMSEEERSKYMKPRRRLSKEEIEELVRLREETLAGSSGAAAAAAAGAGAAGAGLPVLLAHEIRVSKVG